MNANSHKVQHIGNYAVYSDGSIKSFTHWRGGDCRFLEPTYNKDGYKIVRLTFQGKRKKWLVHSLIAALFLPAKPGPILQQPNQGR